MNHACDDEAQNTDLRFVASDEARSRGSYPEVRQTTSKSDRNMQIYIDGRNPLNHQRVGKKR